MRKSVEVVIGETHGAVQQLLDRLRAARSPEVRDRVFDDFAKLLGAYLLALEQSVFPRLRTHQWQGLSSAVLAAHFSVKRCLAELIATARDAARLEAALGALHEALQEQQRHESESLVPALRRLLRDEERLVAGDDMQARMALIVGAPRDRPLPAALAPPAQEVLDEARLVLRGFGRH